MLIRYVELRVIDLDGHVAIITGAAGGIGAATARVLATQGANIVLTDAVDDFGSVVADIRARDKEVTSKSLDVTDADQVEALVEAAMETFGHVDILCNAAGVYPNQPLDEITDANWDRVIDINLKGTFNCVRAFTSQMAAQEYGRIVNISSLAGGHIGMRDGFAHYGASKGGVVGLTRSGALDVAGSGITMNAIVPGMIDTGAPDGDSLQERIEAVPVERLGNPEEIAYATAFLSSKEAGYITGTTLIVDGGYSVV